MAADRPAADEGGRSPLSFMSHNVNSLRSRASKNAPELREFVARHDFDVLLLQETRLLRSDLTESQDLAALLSQPPFSRYDHYWSCHAQVRESGTVIMVKRGICVERVDKSLRGDGGEEGDGRFICAVFPDLVLLNTYVPNIGGKPQSYERRRLWERAIERRIGQLRDEYPAKQLIWGGDLNTCLRAIDVSHPGWFSHRYQDVHHEDPALRASFSGQPGYKPVELETSNALLSRLELHDAYQALHGERRQYTWGGNAGGKYDGKGMRIDFFCLSAALLCRIQAVVIHDSTEEPGDSFLGSDHRVLSLRLLPQQSEQSQEPAEKRICIRM